MGEVLDQNITSQILIDDAECRLESAGGAIKQQAVNNDLSHPGSVLLVARPAWDYEVDPHAMSDARKVLRKPGMVAKRVEWDRRPKKVEIDRLLEYFLEIHQSRLSSINLPKVLVFALSSTHSQEEITRICWEDNDERR